MGPLRKHSMTRVSMLFSSLPNVRAELANRLLLSIAIASSPALQSATLLKHAERNLWITMLRVEEVPQPQERVSGSTLGPTNKGSTRSMLGGGAGSNSDTASSSRCRRSRQAGRQQHAAPRCAHDASPTAWDGRLFQPPGRQQRPPPRTRRPAAWPAAACAAEAAGPSSAAAFQPALLLACLSSDQWCWYAGWHAVRWLATSRRTLLRMASSRRWQ